MELDIHTLNIVVIGIGSVAIVWLVFISYKLRKIRKELENILNPRSRKFK